MARYNARTAWEALGGGEGTEVEALDGVEAGELVQELLRPLADKVNRLRDRIDELLFGYQDFGMVGRRP